MQVFDFLHKNDFFSSFPRAVIQKVADTLSLVYLQGGQVLFHQGEIGDSLYLVMKGRLRVSKGKDQPLADIGTGELVGEIALLLDAPRVATVKALRDSVLLRLTKNQYLALSEQYPVISLKFSQFCIRRLQRPQPFDGSKFVTLVFLPAGENPGFSDFLQQVVSLLEKEGPTLYLNRQRFNAFYGKDKAEVPYHSEENQAIVSWLDMQEKRYRYLVFETDLSLTPWTLRCLRQADRLLFVGFYGKNFQTNAIENFIFKEVFQQRKELILLHAEAIPPTRTKDWLLARSVDAHYHVIQNKPREYSRVVRIVTGKARGLVLAGGGFRAAAYVGLLQALEEQAIEIDMIGANSAGAFIGGLWAEGKSALEIQNLIMKEKYRKNYTLPILSLTTARHFTEKLHALIGEVNIEDVWRNFFCIAYNLTAGKEEIFSQGKLWQAIRTSASIPGIFPPIVNDKGEIVVDGGIYSNVPIEAMRKKIPNGQIIAVSLHTKATSCYTPLPFILSGWKMFFQKYVTRSKQYPSIGEVIVSSMTALSSQKEKETAKFADIFLQLEVGSHRLFQTQGIKNLIENAYQESKAVLKQYEPMFRDEK